MQCQCSIERSKVKVIGGQERPEIAAYLADMFTYGRRLQTRPNPLLGLIPADKAPLAGSADCKLIVKLNLLSVPEIRSATGQTAANHVGTRRRHLLLFYIEREREFI